MALIGAPVLIACMVVSYARQSQRVPVRTVPARLNPIDALRQE